jgi:hypothetical protein
MRELNFEKAKSDKSLHTRLKPADNKQALIKKK